VRFDQLTRGQKTILKTLGMRELNRRKDPVLLPIRENECKPYRALKEAGLVTFGDDKIVRLTESGRDFSLALMR
jgi:hypothetical protein